MSLSFGLKSSKLSGPPQRPPQKRKAAFNEQNSDHEDEQDDAFGALQKPVKKGEALEQRPVKSPRLSSTSKPITNSTNLSALRSAKLQDAQASALDSSVYDYDEVYDALAAQKVASKENNSNGEPVAPKYMTRLLESADTRKRDQLRAKEKALQRERDAEGEELAGKEKFVTGAYKKQQEEMRKLEEEERRREEEEEEARRRGKGMVGFHRDMLRKDEERMKAVEEAARVAAEQRAQGIASTDVDVDIDEDESQKTDVKVAAEMNQKGANVVVNDEGEIVDKRQLLSVGLNIAPAAKSSNKTAASQARDTNDRQDYSRTQKAQDARMSQRERQTRMMERQIEEIERKAREDEEREEKEREEKNKSRLTDETKMSARERYLARKKAQEEEKKAKDSVG